MADAARLGLAAALGAEHAGFCFSGFSCGRSCTVFGGAEGRASGSGGASLDLAHQLLILRLARVHADSGGAVMMVLHDLNLAIMAADEIVALKDGRRIAAGPPASIITDDLIAALYGVRAHVRGVPDGPFILPQTARLPA